MTDDAFILGAGFSKAIHNRMPMLNELGSEAASRLTHLVADHPKNIAVDDFENWLTYLAEDQPWMGEELRLRNRASFLEAFRALRS